MEGPDGQRELHGRQSDRPGAQHCGSGHGDRERRPVAQDHGGRARRDPAAQGGHEHDGRPAAVVRFGSHACGARGGLRGQARRAGDRARRGGHVEGPDRLGQRDGDQSDRAGAQHRGSDHGGGARGPVAQDHGGCARGDPAAQGDHQHDGRSAERLRCGGDPRGARGRHRGQAGRSGRSQGRERHLEGPDRQRQLDGWQPDRPGTQYRRGRDRDRQRRPLAQDHGGCPRGDPAAQGDHQHDGRPAALVRFGSHACRARGGFRGQARRPGQRTGRGWHLEGPHRQRQFDGRQPDGPGAQHRGSDHGGRARGPVAQDHGRRQGRNPAAQGSHQHDGRPAERVRRRGDARGSRGRHATASSADRPTSRA